MITTGNEADKHAIECNVYVEPDADIERVKWLEKQLHVTIIKEMPQLEQAGVVLRLDAQGLALVGNGQTLRGDFTRMLPRLGTANLQRELLVKVSKIKGVDGRLTAIDATAGLGEDALLLAAAGFQVKMYEYNPVIAALLQDALYSASKMPELAEITQRMELVCTDSLTALPQLEIPPDVVLLDPMFPARQKSALIKKKFQLLQQLERPCSDEMELLEAAMACHPRKVVIKRPLKGVFLADRKPDYSLKGKAIRYDCIVIPRAKESI